MTQLFFAALLGLASSDGTGASPIAYTVHLDTSTLSTFTVSIEVPTDVEGELRLALPTWARGRWRPRPWKGRLESVSAKDATGKTVTVSRTGDTLLVDGRPPLQVTCVIGATRQVESVHGYFTDTGALLTGVRTLPYLIGQESRPCTVHIDAPRTWSVESNLPRPDRSKTRHFAATHYHQLVDAAFLCGELETASFENDGTTYAIALDPRGRTSPTPLTSLEPSLKKLATEHDRLHGPVPGGRWTMLMVGNGSRERHLDDGLVFGVGADTLGGDRTQLTRSISESLAAARIRRRLLPPSLLDPDYTDPVKAKELWFVTGWPRWAGRLALMRAGVPPALWRADLFATILEHRNHLQVTRVSPEDASEAMAGAADGLSAALCGHLISGVLDLRLRAAGEDSRSLSVIVTELASRLDGKTPFTLATLRAAVNDPKIGKELHDLVTTPAPLPWNAAMKPLALAIDWVEWKVADPRLGCQKIGNHVVVSTMPELTPLHMAGLRVGDHIRAVGQKRVNEPIDVDRAIAKLKPGRKVRFDIRRDGKPKSIRLTLDAAVELDLPIETRGANVVLKALPPGNARDAGMREGDVLLKIGKVRIGTELGLWQALRRIRTSTTSVTIQRDGRKKTLKVKTPLRKTWRGALEFDDRSKVEARKRLTKLEAG